MSAQADLQGIVRGAARVIRDVHVSELGEVTQIILRNAGGGVTRVVTGVDSVGGGTGGALANGGSADGVDGRRGAAEHIRQVIVGRDGRDAVAGLVDAQFVKVAQEVVAVDARLVDVLIEKKLHGAVGNIARFEYRIASDLPLDREIQLHDVGLAEVGIEEVDGAKSASGGGGERGRRGRSGERESVTRADVTAGRLIREDVDGLGKAGRGAIRVNAGRAHDAIVEHAPGAAHGGFAVLKRGPGEAEAGGKVILVVGVPGVRTGYRQVTKLVAGVHQAGGVLDNVAL